MPQNIDKEDMWYNVIRLPKSCFYKKEIKVFQ